MPKTIDNAKETPCARILSPNVQINPEVTFSLSGVSLFATEINAISNLPLIRKGTPLAKPRIQ